MVSIGDVAKRVNSQNFKVYISTSDSDEFTLMQNASLNMSHSEFREATTSGSVVYYSGLPDNTLSGTILYSTDFGNTNSANALEDWMTTTNGEYATKNIRVKLTGADATTTVFQFTSLAKLTSCTVYKGQEGAVKADITFILAGNPVIS